MNDKVRQFISDYRVFPRIFILTFFFMSIRVFEWFMTLPDPNAEQSAFAGIIATGLVGMVKFYSDSGIKKQQIQAQ